MRESALPLGRWIQMKYGKRSYSILGHSGIDASVLRNVKMPDYLNHDEFDGQTRKKQGDKWEENISSDTVRS